MHAVLKGKKSIAMCKQIICFMNMEAANATPAIPVQEKNLFRQSSSSSIICFVLLFKLQEQKKMMNDFNAAAWGSNYREDMPEKAFQRLITSTRFHICRDSHLFFILKTTTRASAAAIRTLAPSH